MTSSALAAYAGALVFFVVIVAAGIMDLATMRIRNGLVLLLLAVYAASAPFAGFGMHEIGVSLAVALVVLVGAFTFFAFNWIGGGDAKLATVTTLWMGADHAAVYLTYMALFGGVLTLLLLQFRRISIPASWHRRPWLARLHAARTGVPYGAAIAAAALAVFPRTPWVAGF